ncbi:MAG: hypothetical protein KKD28_01960 [Chloroflexi bacterium]|nr:hypothetical protein [Chloroflexota bacterium]MBU1660221.1 hypothetical protein [Chloroflexota bacterium]
MNQNKYRFLLALLTIISVTLACSIDLTGDSNPEATVNALSTSIVQTANAAAEDGDNDTNTDLQVAQAEATQRSQSIESTQTVVAASRDEGQEATLSAAAPVMAELSLFGVNSDNGHVGWMHSPVTLDIDGYMQHDYANDYMHIIARDFVIAADITWETDYGTSGCGFMLRSDGNEKLPNQYMVIITRGGNGHVFFTAIADGELANAQDFYAGLMDRSFDWKNGSTNQLVIVGRGPILEIYTNGIKVGQVDTTQPPPAPVIPAAPQQPADKTDLGAAAQYAEQLKQYQETVEKIQSNYSLAAFNFETKDAVFDEGFVAMLAVAESGRTVCKFDDAWLWLIEEE